MMNRQIFIAIVFILLVSCGPKDEAVFQKAQELGLFSGQEVREIRAEGERVIERIQAKASPFNDGWENWFPDPEWSIPSLPDGWDRV